MTGEIKIKKTQGEQLALIESESAGRFRFEQA